ncbi:hypothetical protein [Bacillus sp. FJAT-28004]|uniref:hypothetical protein n=1 Tax=Bacillus sp. FJAT-28004 TaxID=1679165 RepID=UPI0006B682D6
MCSIGSDATEADPSWRSTANIYLSASIIDVAEQTIDEKAGPYIKPLIIAAIILTLAYVGYQ